MATGGGDQSPDISMDEDGASDEGAKRKEAENVVHITGDNNLVILNSDDIQLAGRVQHAASEVAEGHGEGDIDEPDRACVHRRRVNQTTSFSQEATYFLQSFIVERFREQRFESAPSLSDLRQDYAEEEEGEFVESWRRVAPTMRQIADNVDQNRDFQDVVKTVPEDASLEDIMCYVTSAFSDGRLNWGRVVALFCFAYNVCARKFEQYMEKRFPSFPSWITKLITAIIKFLLVKFADWIINRGGWQSIQEYFGTKDVIWKCLVVLSIALSLGVTVLHLKR